MSIRDLLKKRKIELKFIEDSKSLFDQIKRREIITNDDDFTKGLLKEADIRDFYLIKDASFKEVEEIKKEIKKEEVVGLGGGKAIDVAKKVSFDLNLDFISVPTAPSHDGLISKNCSLYNGYGKRETIPAKYPSHLIIPLYLWRTSGDLRKAGICDLLSNLIALQDLSLAEKRGEKFKDFYKELSFEAVKKINFRNDREFAYSLILSGTAMEQTSRYCSGSEHDVERLLTRKMDRRYLHGQLSGTGALISAKIYSIYADKFISLRFKPRNLFKKIKEKMKKENVYEFAVAPLKDKDFKPEFLKEVSNVRPERYTIWNFINSKEVNWDKVIKEILG